MSDDRPPVPLSQLKPGAAGRVASRDLCCEDCDLLNAMGLTDRCAIRVCRGGEPCIVEVEATRLALSKSVACRIMIDAEPAD